MRMSTTKRAGFPERGATVILPVQLLSIKFCVRGKEESQQHIRGADETGARKTSSSSDPLMV